MPAPWAALPPEIWRLPEPTPVVVTQVQTREIEPGFTVSFPRARYNLAEGRTTFEGGVEARYGPTVLRAESLEIDQRNRTGRAIGKVRVEDPEGSFEAADIEFSWGDRMYGFRARDLRLNLAGVRAESGTINLTATPEDDGTIRIVADDVALTSCARSTPLYEVRARRVTVVTGRNARFEAPTFYLLGQKIATLPSLTATLNPRVRGFRLPGFAYRPDEGFGVNWRSEFAIGDNGSLDLYAAVFQERRPAWGATYSQSRVPYGENAGAILPVSDVEERFRYGYLTTIHQESPEAEQRALRSYRDGFSAQTIWNFVPSGRLDDSPISKMLDLTYERGGPVGSLGYFAQVRAQSIRQNDEPFVTRLASQGALSFPMVQLSPGVDWATRLDAAAFVGGDPYGWIRAETALLLRPIQPIRLAVGAHTSASGGTPALSIDPLVSSRGVTLRADADLGPTQLTYMWKWDSDRKWYSREYQITQVIGCLEGFIQYRQEPQQYTFGVRLRLDDFNAIMRRRTFQRTEEPPPPPVIFGGSKKRA